MASEFKVDIIKNLAGTGPVELYKQSASKAWALVNGTGVIALRDSFNISSVTDLAVGQIKCDYTSAMLTSNHHVSSSLGVNPDLIGSNIGASSSIDERLATSTTMHQKYVSPSTAPAYDDPFAGMSNLGDLA